MIELLGLSGSIRRNSYNTAVLKALQSRLADRGKANLSLFSLHEVPLFNSDLEKENQPAAVQSLKQAIRASQGLILCSPEYCHGMSGVLKNALDWAARPAFKSPLAGKPALIITASTATTGGVRAQYQIRETLTSSLARVVAVPEVVIAAVHKKVADNVFTDEETLAFADQAIDQLVLATQSETPQHSEG